MTRGYVYFIRAVGTNKVKIGYSVSPEWRLATLQTGSPLPLELFGICVGSPATEARFHAAYTEYHCHGEWFDLPDDAIAAIAEDYKTETLRAGQAKQPMTTDGRRLLLLLELSDALAKAIEAGMIDYFDISDGAQVFEIKFCPQHQMVLLPTCPGCGSPTA